MHPDQLIAGLAAGLGLPNLAFNREHVCRLVLDDKHLVDLEWVESEGAVYVYSVVHAHAVDLGERCPEMLAANLFGRATNGATLAMDIERGEVVVNRRFELERLDIDWFLRQLDLFADTVAAWSHRLQVHPPEPGADDASSEDHTAGGLIRV